MLLLLSACDVVVCRCVLELHAIAARKEEGGGEFAVAMTAKERLRFLRGIKADFKEYYTMLGTVNAETSECSRPDDRLSIHDGIRSRKSGWRGSCERRWRRVKKLVRMRRLWSGIRRLPSCCYNREGTRMRLR